MSDKITSAQKRLDRLDRRLVWRYAVRRDLHEQLTAVDARITADEAERQEILETWGPRVTSN